MPDIPTEVAYTDGKSDSAARVLRGVTAAAAVVVALGATDAPARAQAPETVVGVVGGYVDTRQIWKPAAEADRVGGAVLGAFGRVPTGVSWLAVQVEGTWTQRGGDVDLALSGSPARGGTRADYLSVTLRPRAAVVFGPVSVFVAAGPTVEQLLRSRVDPALAPVLEGGVQTVFGVTAGAGLAARIGSRWRAEVEARIMEGLGDAYSGPFVSARNRSMELVARVGESIRTRTGEGRR